MVVVFLREGRTSEPFSLLFFFLRQRKEGSAMLSRTLGEEGEEGEEEEGEEEDYSRVHKPKEMKYGSSPDGWCQKNKKKKRERKGREVSRRTIPLHTPLFLFFFLTHYGFLKQTGVGTHANPPEESCCNKRANKTRVQHCPLNYLVWDIGPAGKKVVHL